MDMMVYTLTLKLTVKKGMRRTGRMGGGSSLGLGSSESELAVELERWVCHALVSFRLTHLTFFCVLLWCLLFVCLLPLSTLFMIL
jgi:hypothetical protein